jgi:predicted nuclease of predicted toxin-antitoxin system
VKFLADECVDAAVVARLRADGHDALSVAELAPGISDDAVLELANADERILVTADADFGELVFRQRRVTFGVLLVRLAGLPSAHKADAVTQVVVEHGGEMAGAFTVLSPGLVRIRPPLQP